MEGLKGVERVQNVSHVSDLDDWIMVPLNETGHRRRKTFKWEDDANKI